MIWRRDDNGNKKGRPVMKHTDECNRSQFRMQKTWQRKAKLNNMSFNKSTKKFDLQHHAHSLVASSSW